MVDDITILRSLHTEAINHEPAITFFQTGSMIAGKPCVGAWIAYGLGSMNQDLPTFVVLNASQPYASQGNRAGHLRAPLECWFSLRSIFRRRAPLQR